MDPDSARPPVKIVGVRFTKGGRTYLFDARNVPDVKSKDNVIVETVRGWQLGEVVQVTDASKLQNESELKRIDRIATDKDIEVYEGWHAREEEVTKQAKRRAEELRLNQVKIVGTEYSFDGSRVSILFSTDSDEKVDLKSLRSDMQRVLHPALVELRSVGPRDVAKIIGGIGACGLEKRCCTGFLNDFSSISIKMAKEQGISLSPTEITGMCGRLRCCLIYEYETYQELRKGLPKRGKRILTPFGEGKVIDVSPLHGTLRIDISEVGIKDYRREDLLSEYEVGGQSAKPEPVLETAQSDFPESGVTLVRIEPQRPRPPSNDQRKSASENNNGKNRNSRRSRFNRRGGPRKPADHANSES